MSLETKQLMNTKRMLAALLLLMMPLGLTAQEAGAGPSARTPEESKAKLLEARPDLPVISISEGQVDGFHEIVLDGGMTLYMSDTEDFMIAGDLFLVSENGLVNATENARTAQRKVLLDSLDESEMLVFAPRPELTQATITVFTDIDCGFCRKLHQEVPELNRLGISVRYLAYPRAGLGSASYDKAVSAWCADNPKIALTKAKNGEPIEPATCDNPVAAQMELGGAFGVTGTPAIFFESGFLQSGYLPAEEMARRLGIN